MKALKVMVILLIASVTFNAAQAQDRHHRKVYHKRHHRKVVVLKRDRDHHM